ncbi:MAG: CNNM domain-containing protein [Mycoplasmataceae bacterium]|nr:CNNM domain-containing protein [Mycoplasmataceae bacterium]
MHWQNKDIAVTITILILFVLSFFCASLETAITATPIYKWESAFATKKKGMLYKRVYMMLKNFNLTLGSCIIGNNITTIVSSVLSGLLFDDLFNFNSAYILLATMFLTFFLMISCEYIPKVLAKTHNIRWLKLFGWGLYGLYVITYPLSWTFDKVFNRKKGQIITTTKQEIKQLLDIANHEGTVEPEEMKLAKKALMFSNTKIVKFMIPRKQVAYIDWNCTIEHLIDQLSRDHYSRLPVMKNDKIVGYVMGKEVAVIYIKNPKINWHNYIFPAEYIWNQATLQDALAMIRRKQRHMLIVTPTKKTKRMIGIITAEMLIEQLTGQIYDETDN